MVRKIVQQGTSKKEKEYLVRYAEAGDLEQAHAYINRLSKEQTYVRLQGEEITLEEEQKFLDKGLEGIANKKAVLLFLIYEDRIHGICAVHMQNKTESHIGMIGLSVDAALRGEGLGEVLLRTTMEEALRELPGLKLFCLNVKSPNQAARSLYKKVGFVEYGTLPGGTQHRGEFVDEVHMYKTVM